MTSNPNPSVEKTLSESQCWGFSQTATAILRVAQATRNTESQRDFWSMLLAGSVVVVVGRLRQLDVSALARNHCLRPESVMSSMEAGRGL